jgi:hypothetical protein
MLYGTEGLLIKRCREMEDMFCLHDGSAKMVAWSWGSWIDI